MKRTAIICLTAFLALSACACSSSWADTTYTVTKSGTDYVVDQKNAVIDDGNHTYQYTITTGSGTGYDIEITYPDGSTYWRHTQTAGSFSSGYSGWSDDYDEARYVDGGVLCDIIQQGAPALSKENAKPGKFLMIFLLLAVGGFNTASPQTAWYLSEGWKFKDAEPSDFVLGITRMGGIICCVIAVILIFAW